MIEIQVFIVGLVLIGAFYYFFGKDYVAGLKERYGYNLLGIPTILAVAGPAIHTLMLFGGAGDSEPAVSTTILMMLLYATPGVALSSLVCFTKTKNARMTAIHVPILYLVAFTAGGSVAVAIIAVIAFFAIKAFSKEGVRTVSSSPVRVCTHCGTKMTGSGACPNCGR